MRTSRFLKILYASLHFLCVLFLCACEKGWLEEKTDKALAVPETSKHYQAILDNFGLLNYYVPYLTEMASDGFYFTDADWPSNAGTLIENAYTWSNKNRYENSGEWLYAYSALLNVNVVMEGIVKLEKTPINANIEGQALFHRSRIFFFLSQIFAPQYLPGKNESAPSIVLKVSSDLNEPITRSNLSATFERIIGDLKIAASLMPETGESPARASRQSAFALLSRVYLSIGNFDSSLTYANKYLAINSSLLDFNMLDAAKLFIGVNPEVSFLDFYAPSAKITSQYNISQTLFDSFENNDLRKTVFFVRKNNLIQFKGTYGNTATDIFRGIATDEIFLTKSECLARLGKYNEAMQTLNELLRTRWKKINNASTYINKTAVNELEALKTILQERKKSLILRGVRWMDMRRLSTDPRFAETYTRTIAGSTYMLEPGSYKYTFPIPDDIIEKSGIQQNPGWQQ
ncbi:RagB/SusD family nutrient uptake outer membrane protein [Chitinophaga lutea]